MAGGNVSVGRSAPQAVHSLTPHSNKPKPQTRRVCSHGVEIAQDGDLGKIVWFEWGSSILVQRTPAPSP